MRMQRELVYQSVLGDAALMAVFCVAASATTSNTVVKTRTVGAGPTVCSSTPATAALNVLGPKKSNPPTLCIRPCISSGVSAIWRPNVGAL